MGFELDRLMRQYGVSTPSIASYSGTLYPGAYDDVVGSKEGQLTPQQYQESLRQYNLDRGVYDKYVQDYQRRVRETPMYLQEQFQPGRSTAAPITTFSPAQTAAVRGTVKGVDMDEMNRKIRDWFAANPNATPAEVRAAQNEWGVSDLDIRNAMGLQRPRSVAYRSATGPGGIGLDAMSANIRKYFGDNPFVGDQAIAAEQARWGTSNEDLYRAMGSYWGNQMGSPTYSNFDPTIAAMTPQQKAAYYNRQLAAGYSDAEIRKAVERSVGPQTDEAWSYLRNLAGGNAPAPTPAPTPAPAPGAGPAPVPTPAPAPREPTDRRQPTGVDASYSFPSWVFTDLSPQEKAALYNNFRNRGLSDAYIRQIADKSQKQTDADWAELTRLAAGMPLNLIPGAAPTKADLQTAVRNYNAIGAGGATPPSIRISQNATPQQKASEYNRLRQLGLSDSQVRALADTTFGKQTDADWAYLQQLAASTASGTAQQGAMPQAQAGQGRVSRATTGQTGAAGAAGAASLTPEEEATTTFFTDRIYGPRYTAELSNKQGIANLTRDLDRAVADVAAVGGVYQPGDLDAYYSPNWDDPGSVSQFYQYYPHAQQFGTAYFVPDVIEVDPGFSAYHNVEAFHAPSKAYDEVIAKGGTEEAARAAMQKVRDDQNALHDRLYYGKRMLGAGGAKYDPYFLGSIGLDPYGESDRGFRETLGLKKYEEYDPSANPWIEYTPLLTATDVGAGRLNYEQGQALSMLGDRGSNLLSIKRMAETAKNSIPYQQKQLEEKMAQAASDPYNDYTSEIESLKSSVQQAQTRAADLQEKYNYFLNSLQPYAQTASGIQDWTGLSSGSVQPYYKSLMELYSDLGQPAAQTAAQAAAPAAQAAAPMTQAAAPAVVSAAPVAAPAPAAQVTPALPPDWNTKSAQQKIDYFNEKQIPTSQLLQAGVSQSDIDWMKSQPQGYRFARGGAVNAPRRFQVGGLNEADQRADMAELSERYGVPLPDMPEAPMGVAPATAPAMPMGAPAPAQPMDLQSMLARYMQPGASTYGAELTAARKKSEAETAAFQKMLQDAIQGSGEGGGPSKAEMYFRLAAAFAEPGKTGSFGEGLGRAAGAMAEQQKTEREARRAAAREKLQLGLTAQQARMAGAREDVSSLRQLAGEEMKDKRTITAELLKEWAKRNDPVSTAGKQAQDEGLVPGTPEFQKRVREISELAVERANMQITAAVAGMNTQAANLALAQAREARVAKKEEDASKKLTPQELKLKTETEDLIASADSALGSLRQAYKLNPNTFDASLPDMAQRKILEAAGSKDPKLINTRTMENLLGEQALSKLKSTFGAAPTEGERKILMDLQGIGAKSREERAAIMRTAFQLLQTARDRQQRRLNEITQGLYRDVGTPAAGGLE